MTVQDLNTIIEAIGLPCAYYQFSDDTAQAPPFICWFFTDSDDFYADDVNFTRIRPLRIELYTDFKDFDLENTVEAALTAAGLSYARDEGAIDTERMYMVAYSADVLLTN